MLRLKDGVSLVGLSEEMRYGLHQIVPIVSAYDETECCWVTSGRDGHHNDNSKHYTGNAIDIRIRNISTKERTIGLVKDLNKTLGYCFDIVLEDTHIHIEFDPK